ncbi:unnamed protein product [Owenia fusiformis]|uniref:Uncharacterized protein n=1 Tax=Owenia fusiformis TaxID=6347 RepID=A0A8J1U525_OWEFU|nr:unnamed protein product [Owenia fusiformis]
MAAADTLVYNARIWQSGGEDASWMVFSTTTGLIKTLGRADPPLKAPDVSCSIDYKGKRIFPGFHDSHIHVSLLGQAMRNIELNGAGSIDEFKERIRSFAAAHPEREWLFGRHWEEDVMGRYPTKDDIEDVCPNRPVIVSRACGHIAVVNSKAFEIAGFDETTKDIVGGKFERYPPGHIHEGKLTGIVKEKALDLFDLFITPDSTEWKESIELALKHCLEKGITAVHSNEPCTWGEYCELADENRLPIRVFFAEYFESLKANPEASNPKPKEAHGELLSCDRVKVFADGALGASTAALSEPYKGCQHKGLLLQPQEVINDLVAEAHTTGYRLEIHVIGDEAANAAIEALEKAGVLAKDRPILTHCQILREDLLARMKRLGVVANIQPQFVNTDGAWLNDRLAGSLLEYSYVWKTLLENGIHVAGGSDAPVESPEPFLGIYDAIFRHVGTRGANSPVHRPDQCYSLKEAVDLYTKGGAYATHREGNLGQLSQGYFADFVVMDDNEDVCEDPRRFLTAKAAEVWVAGKRKLNIYDSVK